MNIAEILKYCPKGTKLYSTAFGEVEFINIIPLTNMVSVQDIYDTLYTFYSNGSYVLGGECILFPSIDQRDWSKFRLPLKRGDIMMKADGTIPFIASGEFYEDTSPKYICGVDINGHFSTGIYGWTSGFYIPASEKVKKEFFNKIIEAGYIWNTDTLELEKIESRFKEGDVVVDSDDYLFLFTGVIKDDKIQVCCLFTNGSFVDCGVSMHPSPISSLKLASVDDRNNAYSLLVKGGYKYDKEQHNIVKQEFKPFEKVLVRDTDEQAWCANYFSHYKNDPDYFYVCINGIYHYCIPYNEHTAHLLGTTDPYTEGGSK